MVLLTERKLARGLAALAISALALTGCSSGPTGGDHDKQDAEAKSGSSQAGVSSPNFDDIIVSQDIKLDGELTGTLTVGVMSLKVEGKVQTLRLAVTPHLDSVEDDELFSIYDVWNERGFAPKLVDKENLKVYSPISDYGQKWTSDAVYTETKNGETMEAWAVYAAPQDDIDSVDIRLQEDWPDFTDVPITR